jgi:two-component system CheB/CheR fusion protein
LEFGKGLNSLRIRFTLMVAVASALSAGAAVCWFENGVEGASNLTLTVLSIGLVAVITGSAALTYFMTGKLTRPIENLRLSTQAIANGDYDAPVRVECSCEVGGLADSFRAMVNRLNSNVTRIQTLAYEDGVTGLPNRKVLHEALDIFRSGEAALLFIDLDNFKQVNDLYGHQVGDQLLRAVAGRIQTIGLGMEPAAISTCLTKISKKAQPEASCRMLFRFAGDEFVVLLGGNLATDEVVDIARNIGASLSESILIEGIATNVGCSIGIARLGVDTQDVDELLKFADIAMYAAKEDDKGGFRLFDEAMREKSIDRAKLELELLSAFDREEFVVHYQPKFSVKTGRIEGVEALVRWQHPVHGIMYPGQFLEIAETNNLMGRLGMEVFRQVAGQALRWHEDGTSISISINICPSQFLNQDFSSNLIHYCDKLGANPEWFVLEITETVAMSDQRQALAHLSRLQNAGFKIAIDDFGVGYSNLAKLYQLPFNELKIDRSLIEHIDTDHSARKVVEYTISMAHSLGHHVVAEGVERQRQLEVLNELECDLVQGFLLGRPVPAAQIDTQLNRRRKGLEMRAAV